MNFKKVFGLTVSTLALSMAILGDANAAGVSVKCEARNNRSKASVDGSGVRGTYYAKLTSGGATVKSKNQVADPVTREVEFDFDSNPRDIAAGATKISSTFIKGASVVGTIFNASTNAAVASAKADCRVR